MYFDKKNIKILIFFSLLFVNITYADDLNKDNLDSLYNYFISLNSARINETAVVFTDNKPIKCGFPLVSEINNNYSNFQPKQQAEIKAILQWPEAHTSIVSPSGIFRIHYDTIGINVPEYNSELSIEENVHQIALAIDSAYNFEINFLGFEPPPADNNEGGDNLYDIFIKNLSGIYGQTNFFPEASSGKTPSYIEIDNDFVGFFTQGLDAAKATLAHEFHHAIQIGSYKVPDGDIFFYELNSTSMEEFVFDDVNDYYAYIPSYFENTSKAFSSFGGNSGYDLCLWNFHLKDKFGFEIIKRQWELFRNMRAIHAINSAILEAGSTFKTELSHFGLKLFFTDERYDKGIEAGFVFKEGRDYPTIKYLSENTFSPPDDMFSLNLFPASNSFILIKNNLDSLVVMVTNSDITEAVNNPFTRKSINYFLYDNNADGSTRLTDSYFKKEEAANLSLWKTSEVLNNVLLEEVALPTVQIDNAFPSPFIYGKIYQNGNFIRIPVNNPENPVVDFNVYTSSMDLVSTMSARLEYFQEVNSYVIKWNPLDNNGEKLASGVYIYAVKTSDEVSLGKLVIFNE